MLVINCKNHVDVSTAARIAAIMRAAERTAARYKIKVAVAPPQHFLGTAVSVRTGSKRVIVMAQHTDDHPPGSTTGHLSPALLRRAGIRGSIINHSEHRLKASQIQSTLNALHDAGLISVLCVKNVAEVRRYAALEPDYVAIEPPELIGTGKAVSTTRPGLISGAADVLRSSAGGTKLLCGAGIVSGTDVQKAAELGSKGILVSSGIIKKPQGRWQSSISELAKPLAMAEG